MVNLEDTQMQTITINLYDPEGRFNLSGYEAKAFFEFVEKEALEAGYSVTHAFDVAVDTESEDFVSKMYEKWAN